MESTQHGQPISRYSRSTELPRMGWNNIRHNKMHRFLPTRRSHRIHSHRRLRKRSQELETWCFVSNDWWVSVALQQVQKHEKHSTWNILHQLQIIHPSNPRFNVLLVPKARLPLLPSTTLPIRQRINYRRLEEFYARCLRGVLPQTPSSDWGCWTRRRNWRKCLDEAEVQSGSSSLESMGIRRNWSRHPRVFCSHGRPQRCKHSHPHHSTIYSSWHHDLQRPMAGLQWHQKLPWTVHPHDRQPLSKLRQSCHEYAYSEHQEPVDVYEDEEKGSDGSACHSSRHSSDRIHVASAFRRSSFWVSCSCNSRETSCVMYFSVLSINVSYCA